VRTAIATIPESDWMKFSRWRNRRDGSLHEQDQDGVPIDRHAPPREQDLFEEKSPYSLPSNRPDEDAQATMELYARRGDASRKPQSKDLKIGFGMEYMPFGTFQANTAFFAVGALIYNLYLAIFGLSQRRARQRSKCRPCAGGRFRRRARSSGVFQNQRRHAGPICRDPRVLRARHAGRRRHSRNVVILATAFTRFWEAAHTAPPIAKPASMTLENANARRCDRHRRSAEGPEGGREPQNRLKIHLQSKESASFEIPSRILGFYSAVDNLHKMPFLGRSFV
jgi:hypothetical protein